MSSLIYNSKQPDYKYSQEVNLEIILHTCFINSVIYFLFSRITYFIHFIYLFFFKLGCQPHRKVKEVRHGQWANGYKELSKRVHKVFFEKGRV